LQVIPLKYSTILALQEAKNRSICVPLAAKKQKSNGLTGKQDGKSRMKTLMN
jgi:hypothetical protein